MKKIFGCVLAAGLVLLMPVLTFAFNSSASYTTLRTDYSWQNGDVKASQFYDMIVLNETNEAFANINRLIYQNRVAYEQEKFLPETDWSYLRPETVLRDEHVNTVSYNQNGILCIKTEKTYYSGGHYEITDVAGQAYDLNTGLPLDLCKATGKSEQELTAYFINQSKKHIRENFSYYQLDGILDLVDNYKLDHFNYYINQNGDVVICYPTRAFSWQMGCIEVVCPVQFVNQYEIKVIKDGDPIQFDQPPIMLNDRVLVPIRAIAESMGCTVDWNDQTKTAFLKKEMQQIQITINSNQILIQTPGADRPGSYLCDVPAQLIGGRTLVPVRAVSECLGANVTWDEPNQTVHIKTK